MSDHVIDPMWNRLDPVFEGFAVEMVASGQKQKLRTIISQELGKHWKIRPFGDAGTDFEVTSPSKRLSVDQAWQQAYHLRGQAGIMYAEPIFAVAVMNRPDWNQPVTGQAAAYDQQEEALGRGTIQSTLCFESEPLPGSSDPEWSLREMRVIEAWQSYFSSSPSTAGEGILVGHPDTGYTRHPEIADNLADEGYDFVNNDEDAEDELLQGILLNPGHGTGTASVIVSPCGVRSGSSTQQGVTGIAPGAKVIPIRVSPSVVQFSTLNLARAIEYAARRGVHVISISMGGVLSWRLREAVTFAQKRGVIVLAAAGNCVRFVVWPAAYDEVIAVAASNANTETWRGSSRGRAVDVTAPGESVWRADVDPNNVAAIFTIGRGSGTSYAVAGVAGIAVLWLARHGRAQLIQRYGVEKIPFIFNQILRKTCTSMSGPTWTPGDFGAGLVNAEAVLAAPLPDGDTRAIPAAGLFLEAHAEIDKGGLATFSHLFERRLAANQDAVPELQAGVLQDCLAQLLGMRQADLSASLKEIGQELAFHFAVNPELYKQFETALVTTTTAADRERLSAQAVDNAASIRTSMMAAHVSTALRQQLDKATTISSVRQSDMRRDR